MSLTKKKRIDGSTYYADNLETDFSDLNNSYSYEAIAIDVSVPSVDYKQRAQAKAKRIALKERNFKTKTCMKKNNYCRPKVAA